MMLGMSMGLSRPNGRTMAQRIKALFAQSEQGAWYGPSDWSTLFQGSAGTLPVTAVGQPVGRMLDKSGRGNHCSQSTAINRPILQQDGNGRYYLAFNGTNSWMQTASIDFTATDKMTVALGIAKDTVATSLPFEVAGTFNGVDGGYGLVLNDAAPLDYFGFRGVGADALFGKFGGGTAPSLSVLVATLNQSGASNATRLTTRRNGADQSLGYGGSILAPGTFRNAPIFLGSRGGVASYFQGKVYGLIIRGALSSTPQIASAERYMAGKTGVTL